MLALHAALVKGFFAEEGLRVQGSMVDARAAIEQNKPHWLWVKTDKGLTEADFGFLLTDHLHRVAAGEVDFYIVDGIHPGCEEVLVPPGSPIQSAAGLKGKTVAIAPNFASPAVEPAGHLYFHRELKAAGLDPVKDVTQTPIPWESLPKLADYVAEGFKTGKFEAVNVGEPAAMTLRQRNVGQTLFSLSRPPHNQEYCCLLGIKKAVVDNQPEKAALIVQTFRRAKQWVAQNPTKAVIAGQTAGYYAATLPVEPSANALVSFEYDRVVDVAKSLERSFQERIDAGVIKTDKTAQELVRLHYRKID
jgi:NitT/TauT family transport system substrate-binding protein